VWSQRRTVTKNGDGRLHGNTFEVDAALVGRRVELVFDPFNLAAWRSASRAAPWAPRRPTSCAATPTPIARELAPPRRRPRASTIRA
jgi:putative transposase